jgi:hypothetical protein
MHQSFLLNFSSNDINDLNNINDLNLNDCFFVSMGMALNIHC